MLLLVGLNCGAVVETFGGQAGANDVDAVEGGFGGDLVVSAQPTTNALPLFFILTFLPPLSRTENCPKLKRFPVVKYSTFCRSPSRVGARFLVEF